MSKTVYEMTHAERVAAYGRSAAVLIGEALAARRAKLRGVGEDVTFDWWGEPRAGKITLVVPRFVHPEWDVAHYVVADAKDRRLVIPERIEA
jgi:hypothetical protein